MSVNVLSERNVKRWAQRLDLPIERIVCYSHHESGRFLMARLVGDRHIVIDRKTGEWENQEPPQHWSSCRETFGELR